MASSSFIMRGKSASMVGFLAIQLSKRALQTKCHLKSHLRQLRKEGMALQLK